MSNVLVLTCRTRRVLESKEKRSCPDGEYTRRRSDRQARKGMHQRKRSDKEMVTYSQYVLVSAASEEFRGGVKHDFRYEL